MISSVVVGTLALAACGDDDGGADEAMDDVVGTYAEGVHAAYSQSLQSARSMDESIDDFLGDPTEAGLERARQSWLVARDDYGVTEAFRFYGGPIDDPDDGVEGLINAWPMDEAYVDYVEGDPDAGIVNDPDAHPSIDRALLVELNEAGGETNISTGWHAIEFLLWGQDLSEDGAGTRPANDYVDAPNAERRATYLTEVTDLLLGHLGGLVEAWDPAGSDNFHDEFVSKPSEEAMTDIITGVGELSRGELAGERMNVAYTERSQEDEHSCFSDNTTSDLVANAEGIEMVLTADYPGEVEGTSVLDAIAEVDPELADQLRSEVRSSVEAVAAIPAPFDQHLRDGVADTDPGRASVLAGIEALEAQTPTIVAGAEALGLRINVS
jgi:putative iron-regulated protein